MRRREFITLLGGAAAAWPLAARAQQRERMRRIGVLTAGSDETIRMTGPHRGASCRGCRNWAGPTAATCGSKPAGPRPTRRRFADTRRNLVALAPDVILAYGTDRIGGRCCRRPAPCRSCSSSVVDPVGAGFVDSLARPGGNATGFTHVRIRLEREMAGAAQADRARRDASGGPSGSRPSPRGSASSPPSRPWRRRLGVEVKPDRRARRG